MAFHGEALSAWLRSNGAPPTSDTHYAQNHLPMDPDKVLMITQTPGPPSFHTEEAFDNQGVQIRTRSPRNDAYVARTLIEQIDQILMDDTLRPFTLDGRYVLQVSRQGGSPSYLATDQRHRTHYVCNYVLTLARL